MAETLIQTANVTFSPPSASHILEFYSAVSFSASRVLLKLVGAAALLRSLLCVPVDVEKGALWDTAPPSEANQLRSS